MNFFTVIKKMLKSSLNEALYSDPRLSVKLYRKKGCKIGEGTLIYNTKIDNIRPYLVSIGNNCVITGVTILTHDASFGTFSNYTKVGKVTIGNNVFIGIESIILPGNTIGNNVIIGSGTIVSKDIPDNCVVAGNPMRIICSVDEFIEKNNNKIDENSVFNKSELSNPNNRDKMIEALNRIRIGYIDNSK